MTCNVSVKSVKCESSNHSFIILLVNLLYHAKRRSSKHHALLSLAPPIADTDKTSTCYTEERKAKIEGREEAFITVLAEGERGSDRNQKTFPMVYLFFV